MSDNQKISFTLAILVFILTAGAVLSLQAQTRADGAGIPAVTHNTWTSGAPIPTAVYFPATGVLKNEVYVVGGGVTYTTYTADTQIYNPVTNAWSTGVPLPAATIAGMAAVVKNILYIFGGSTSAGVTNAVWAFNPKTKAWTAAAPMPTARLGGVALVDKDIIYVIGGGNLTEQLDTVESFDPATGTWTEENPLFTPKSQLVGGLVGTTIIAADGITNPNDITADNEGYDAATNVWTSLQGDPTGRAGACGGSVGSSLYVAGGYSTGTTTLTEAYKPSKKAWTTLAVMPEATLLPGSAVYKGKLYCVGGITTYEGSLLNYLQIYQP